jgi:hypothetical protein
MNDCIELNILTKGLYVTTISNGFKQRYFLPNRDMCPHNNTDFVKKQSKMADNR